MSVLITGGAGYVGRHTARYLAASGRDVVVLDNLVTGRRESAGWRKLILGDVADVDLVRRVLREENVTAVVHLAASAHVGDSMTNPAAYYANNVCATSKLLMAMMAERVFQLVFASSCSVYGNSASMAVREDERVVPMSPYGESKLVTERALPWYERAHRLNSVALRYFNVAGAEAAMGEDVAGCRRIIPRTVHAATNGGAPLLVYGTEFQTPDGSAVRDYVHVCDVARANVLALAYVEAGKQAAVINIGAGIGTSVLEIVAEVGKQVGKPVPHHLRGAQPGDPACAISDRSLAKELLGWEPERSGLEQIVASILRSARLRATA